MKYFLGKTIFVLVLIFSSLTVFAFGGRAPQTVVGHIKYYGNVPFEFPGIETVDGYHYSIKVEEGAEFTVKDITDASGYMLEFTGQIEKSKENAYEVLKDGVFVVSEFKKL